ncbi:MAG: hypothetical protein ACKPKO_49370, partial [Candidatus Fonsibacter sp.]
MFIAKLLVKLSAQSKISALLVFGDLRKAYYGVLVELVLGPPLTASERQVVLQHSGMDALRM